MNFHWTERSLKDFQFRIAFDLIAQFEKKMEADNISQAELAKRLNITKGRVSQVLNNPDNISLGNIVKYARKLDMKISIIAYEDDDPQNKRGPINSEIFKICWEQCDKPHDFWAFQENEETSLVTANATDAKQGEPIFSISSAVPDIPCCEKSTRQNIDPMQKHDAVGLSVNA